MNFLNTGLTHQVIIILVSRKWLKLAFLTAPAHIGNKTDLSLIIHKSVLKGREIIFCVMALVRKSDFEGFAS